MSLARRSSGEYAPYKRRRSDDINLGLVVGGLVPTCDLGYMVPGIQASVMQSMGGVEIMPIVFPSPPSPTLEDMETIRAYKKGRQP